jgi:hypothetical protein
LIAIVWYETIDDCLTGDERAFSYFKTYLPALGELVSRYHDEAVIAPFDRESYARFWAAITRIITPIAQFGRHKKKRIYMSAKGNQNVRKPSQKKRERQIHIVTSIEEYEVIADGAKKAGLSIASFIRAAAIKAARGEQ